MPGQIARSRAARTRDSVRGRFVRRKTSSSRTRRMATLPRTLALRRLRRRDVFLPAMLALLMWVPSALAANDPPVNTERPAISGSARYGQTLTGTPGCLDGQRADHVCLPVAPLRHGWKQLRRHRLGDGSHLHARRSRHRRACPHPRLGDERVRQRRPALLALGDRRVGTDQRRSSGSLRRRQERRDAHRLDGDLDR